MYKYLFWIFLGGVISLTAATVREPQRNLPRSVPEKEGVSSAVLLRFLEAVEKSGIDPHSFMLVRHGKVVAEGWWSPFRAVDRQNQHSVSKAVLSLAIGLAVQEKKLSVDDRVVSFFPEKLPDSIPPYLQELRIRDLLTMTVGQDPAPAFTRDDLDWVGAFLTTPLRDRPGSRFLYNTYASYLLSAVLQRVTGQPVVDYLGPRLFEPLDIRDAVWENGASDINAGGWGLRIRTEDMAKLGQLYLQQGSWNGRQLLPAAWIEEATASHILQHPDWPAARRDSSDWEQGYGYQLWRSRHDSFRADGAYGQFMLILPEADAVVVMTARNTGDPQRQLNLVWDYLLPAFRPASLPENSGNDQALRRKLETLHTGLPEGIASFAGENTPERTYRFTDNAASVHRMSYRIWNKTCYLTLQGKNAGYPIVLGWKKWRYGKTMRPNPYFSSLRRFSDGLLPSEVAGMYYWKDADTLVMTWMYPEDGEREHLTCRFRGDDVEAVFWDSSRKPGDSIRMQGRMTGRK